MNDLVTGLSGGLKHYFGSFGDPDDLMGIHLNVLVPLEPGFYKAMVAFKDVSRGTLKREFSDPGSMLATVTIPSVIRGGASSVHVTYGFVSSSSATPLGKRLSYQGGYGLTDDTGDSNWLQEMPAISVWPM